MAHDIGVWRRAQGVGSSGLSPAEAEGEAELPLPEDLDLVIELLRQYPGLSRHLAEYLAR